MKKLGIAFLLMLLVTAVMALPAAAKPKEPVGTQISLFGALDGPPMTFAADTAFNIRHGWAKNPTTEAVGHFSFALDLDGTRLTEDFVLRTADAVLPGRRSSVVGLQLSRWLDRHPRIHWTLLRALLRGSRPLRQAQRGD